ncbi:putative uncharacterized protein [Mycoplasma sp. CAG:776]|nr:putative uncharacterized protein [Mycoplasma sp. CAG:776]
MKGKLIIIEGTDCSGKETQTKLLVEKLKKDGEKVATLSFPMYGTPSGRIVGACLLGKPQMCDEYLKENHGFFPEGGGEVDSLAALCYYAADRRYNLPIIEKYLNEGYTLIVDRYVTSNMAHRGGMLETKEERLKMYQKIDTLEYALMELPRPDQVILLYMPYEQACELKKKRRELPDETEMDENYLKRGERAYLELADIYHYDIVNCVESDRIRTIEDINQDVYKLVRKR